MRCHQKSEKSFVMVQAVYDTFDILPVEIEANADLMSQPNARFVFIGINVFLYSRLGSRLQKSLHNCSSSAAAAVLSHPG